jgi:Tripartite tricarboxylate transporter family receptor
MVRDVAPATTPAGIIDSLQRAVADVLAQPLIVQVIAKVGGLVQTGAAEALAAYQRAEFTKWGRASFRSQSELTAIASHPRACDLPQCTMHPPGSNERPE